ncbi:Uncharacterised protein [Mycobacteroides abscessus subsp. abscessus]|nr:Uncharacterised protein [Mycobacteroides abscessus subsp. abscessus]
MYFMVRNAVFFKPFFGLAACPAFRIPVKIQQQILHHPIVSIQTHRLITHLIAYYHIFGKIHNLEF